ncbi:MAG TPA: phosphate signaling complex protein PhoU [Firmicutes bacterium]|uniref:Phosphate-specific transport system accessory protein PhoU n=1 Tax=Capillibacterium thermochitinicola TaxID=2699427 RepID=A0A8J6LMW5_9FIRM|nr:phosphate signaling complex protein PhoU [Capillibacterium thermochitinicola]MBA2133278.1 phosphate signaling complex protein PhoU [Capillibacterium thermochitinicola]HHW12483.1 phosphate signaling complex protein PhoU [Bacillota bacterium]
MNQLEQLMSEIKKMGDAVKERVQRSINALVEKNPETALEIIREDDLFDNELIVFEDKITRFLAEKNPHGKELRNSLSIFKMAKDLERIADYATNIAEIVLEFKNEEYIEPLTHIPKLASLALNMLEVALRAFVDGNPDLAEAVCRKDEEADNLCDIIYKELTSGELAEGQPRSIRQTVRFNMIARFLERIADHATNIGEETILLHTGKRVKY